MFRINGREKKINREETETPREDQRLREAVPRSQRPHNADFFILFPRSQVA